MTLQYSRFYTLYSAIRVVGETEERIPRDELLKELVARQDLEANPEKESGARDILLELRNAALLVDDDGYRLTKEEDLPELDLDSQFLYSGSEVYQSIEINDTVEAQDRILTNLAYSHPELLRIASTVFNKPGINKNELEHQLDGEAVFGNKLNSFTISMGVDLLSDAGVIREQDSRLVSGQLALSVFANLLYKELHQEGDVQQGLSERELFSRFEMKYGIDRDTFDRYINRLDRTALIDTGSYQSLEMNPSAFREARIHE